MAQAMGTVPLSHLPTMRPWGELFANFHPETADNSPHERMDEQT